MGVDILGLVESALVSDRNRHGDLQGRRDFSAVSESNLHLQTARAKTETLCVWNSMTRHIKTPAVLYCLFLSIFFTIPLNVKMPKDTTYSVSLITVTCAVSNHLLSSFWSNIITTYIEQCQCLLS